MGDKTPNASIRRIVQRRSQFFKIRPGLWALSDHRDELPDHIYSEGIASGQEREYTHSYFQGLLSKAGNSLAAETWIPTQDKNKPFLDRRLTDVRTLYSLPEFGYERMIRRAATVDVVWFNSRRMPGSLMEVEFSTDCQNSLHKFLDLRDYYANFAIAADENRRGQFEKRLEQTGFEPIRDRVKFMTFEEVTELHSATEVTNGTAQHLLNYSDS